MELPAAQSEPADLAPATRLPVLRGTRVVERVGLPSQRHGHNHPPLPPHDHHSHARTAAPHTLPHLPACLPACSFSTVCMFADVSGFTALSEAMARYGPEGAEYLAKHLNSYFSQMVKIIASMGGDIFKVRGGGEDGAAGWRQRGGWSASHQPHASNARSHCHAPPPPAWLPTWLPACSSLATRCSSCGRMTLR